MKQKQKKSIKKPSKTPSVKFRLFNQFKKLPMIEVVEQNETDMKANYNEFKSLNMDLQIETQRTALINLENAFQIDYAKVFVESGKKKSRPFNKK